MYFVLQQSLFPPFFFPSVCIFAVVASISVSSASFSFSAYNFASVLSKACFFSKAPAHSRSTLFSASAFLQAEEAVDNLLLDEYWLPQLLFGSTKSFQQKLQKHECGVSVEGVQLSIMTFHRSGDTQPFVLSFSVLRRIPVFSGNWAACLYICMCE